MNNKMGIRMRLAAVFLAANLVLWVTFWVDFSRRLAPYHAHAPQFEEMLPLFVFGEKALPNDQMGAPLLRLIERVQMPSFLAVRPVVYALNQRPSVWEKTLLGISPWAYLLMTVTLLSFLQWYLVARLVSWLVTKSWSRGF